MKKILSAAAVLAMFSVRGEGRLDLSVSIDGLPEHEVVYLYGMNSKIFDSTTVANHAFAFHKEIPKGDLFIIQVGRTADLQRQTMVYLEPGNVSAKGQGPFLTALQFTGPAYVQEAREVEKMMSDTTFFQGEATLMQDMMDAQKIGDKDRLAELAKLKNDNDSMRNVLGGQWVRSHLNSPISASVLNFFMANRLGLDSLRWYVSQLGPQAKDNYLAEKLAVMTNFSSATAVGSKSMDFTQPDTQGHNVSLAGLKGKWVLLDFWASWCGPCRATTPKLKAIYDKFKDKNFTILSVSIDTDKEKWLKAIADDKMDWPQVSDLARQNKAAQLYGVSAIPASFLIDPKGKIVAYSPNEDAIEKILKNAQ